MCALLTYTLTHSYVQVALPWMQLGFVGLLEVDQVLQLWDRIFGYMDITLCAVLSVAIFVFRAVPLFQCNSASEALIVLNEGLGLKVVPLLQMYLCSEGTMLSYSSNSTNTNTNAVLNTNNTNTINNINNNSNGNSSINNIISATSDTLPNEEI